MTGWIDLTHPVHEAMPVWEESERASITTRCEIDGDCPVRVSWIALGAHTGTHVDARPTSWPAAPWCMTCRWMT